jgi:hypothetical protein
MPSNSIKPIIYLVALLGVTPAAWAGAAEEDNRGRLHLKRAILIL